MEPGNSSILTGAEIHGFHMAEDLDIEKLLGDASWRWFRPNEVYAILSNYTRFKIQPQPVDFPASGSVLLFDRTMLRNFRKDGHNWKKKKDGKTVQEAHEKLKIGNEERIHVYYARSENDPSFYRRCYWLLDKKLERIVLVHYRHTSEDNAVQHLAPPVECTEALVNKMHHGSPLTPVDSTSGSAQSELSGTAVISEEINSGEEQAMYPGVSIPLVKESTQLRDYELSLHEINTLDWADLVEAPTYVDSGRQREGYVSSSGQHMQYELRNSMHNGSLLPSEMTSSGYPTEMVTDHNFTSFKQMSNNYLQTVKEQETVSLLFNSMNPNSQAVDFKSNAVACSDDVLPSQNSFGQWNYTNYDSLGSLHDLQLDASISIDDKSEAIFQSSTQEQSFSITDISPAWAYSTEETKVLVIGCFNESHKHLVGSKVYCVFGQTCVAAEMIQVGVYRCTAVPQTPGLVNLFLTLDGNTPISQVLSFEYRISPNTLSVGGLTSPEVGNEKFKKSEVQIRLAHVLFSTTNILSILSSRIQPKSLKEAKRFASLTSPLMEKNWMSLHRLNRDCEEDLFELVLKNKLQEWLLAKIAEGCKITDHDSKGQGVIHLCAILDYAWAVRLFSSSSFSLDFRDAFGWTALHWAAYCGREKMVAALLSAGANPSLVTDPTQENLGGCTAADLASKGGYDGLAAYLAEKGLAAHFEAMSLCGNITATVPSTSNNILSSEMAYYENLSEQELCLKESLAAYRNAADAADRIQAAFRERALKLQAKEVQLAKPEMEATQIVSALKIQHAFRNYSRGRMMKAAARIQSHFRTWQTRRSFLNLRKQAIRIQAAYRGHQMRRQYRKIIWSVGVLEKALLRWRLKRKGLRGIKTEASMQAMRVDREQEESRAEEDFFRVSREQAEERVQRSVIRVQAMFRSYQAQQEYRRMKQAHEQAKLDFNVDGAYEG